jgi:hypothetical protein
VSGQLLGLTPVLAHQSDWLSMVLVLIPLSVFAWVLAVANHRAERDGPVALEPPAEHSADPDPDKLWK